jgi:hypothetical protein
MMMDRTTKFLLVAIALALWGLLLRPAVTPAPVQAQVPDPGVGSSGGMVVTNQDVYIRTSTGNLYRFERNLQIKDRAIVEVVNGETRYVHHSP